MQHLVPHIVVLTVIITTYFFCPPVGTRYLRHRSLRIPVRALQFQAVCFVSSLVSSLVLGSPSVGTRYLRDGSLRIPLDPVTPALSSISRSLYVHQQVSFHAFVGLFPCISRSLYMHQYVSLVAPALSSISRSPYTHQYVSLHALAGLFTRISRSLYTNQQNSVHELAVTVLWCAVVLCALQFQAVCFRQLCSSRQCAGQSALVLGASVHELAVTVLWCALVLGAYLPRLQLVLWHALALDAYQYQTQQLKASYNSSLRPHTLVVEGRIQWQLKASYTSS